MRKVWLGIALCLPLLALGCAGTTDSAQIDLCRHVLPALHPDGTILREIRIAPVDPQTVRVEYAAREPNSASRAHFAACSFEGGRYDAGRLNLVGVDTDSGALGEARLLYLKRFWLAPMAGGEIEAPLPPVPEIPRGLAYAAQQAINALALAAIYGLLGVAYSLVYGLVGRINLAFGDIAVVGAYAAIGGVAAVATFGWNDPISGLALALLVAAVPAALWSWCLGNGVVAPLHLRFREGQPILVATAAAAVFIQEFLRLFEGVRERWLPPFFSGPIPLMRAGRFVVTVAPIQLCVAAAAFAAALGLLVLMARTRLGREWRAFADDPSAAAMFGVEPARILSVTFMLAGLCAGLAGWIVAVYYGNVSFSMGTMFALKALLAAIVGGIGRIEGALLGGILIGLIEAAWSAYFDISSRDIVLFSLLVIIFVLRPGGLLGFAGPSPREV